MAKFNKAFWKWFGDSKVVDAKGNPLVMYHGTKSVESLTSFSRKGNRYNGIYFSADFDYASEYAEGQNGGIISAFVRIESTFVVNLPPWDGAIIINNRIEGFYRDLTDSCIEKMIGFGYDGIIAIVNDALPNKGKKPVNPFEIVAFYPNQIKAIDNDGTLDIDDSDIRSNPYDEQPLEAWRDVEYWYHGTSSKFDEFYTPAYFTNDPEVPFGYKGQHGRVVKAKLNIKNPAFERVHRRVYYEDIRPWQKAGHDAVVQVGRKRIDAIVFEPKQIKIVEVIEF
jgi:hypothetical protein